MALFSSAQIDKINQAAEKSKERMKPPTKQVKSMTNDIEMMSAQVMEYFKDSKSILITTEDQLAEYIDNAIKAGYCGVDTETTGLDRVKDVIVGSSLYYPGGVECYIPNKHRIPIFDDLRKNQLSYEQCQRQFQRLVDNNVKMIFANADFDIAMIYKDYGVDLIDVCYYDCILAWRCIKENELHNGLKELYNKYVLGGKGDPKKFNDFFDVKLFPYCKPEVAKLYAANDAKITYDLFRWQLPYITKSHSKCKKHGLEKIADVVWGIEFPMIRVCAMMHRTGSYLDSDVARSIDVRYDSRYNEELKALQDMVQTLIDDRDIPTNSKRPFKSGRDFNPTSVTHARYLCYTLLNVAPPSSGKDKGKQSTSKEVLAELNLPETNQLLKVRSLSTLIGTFVKKLPKTVTPDNRIHAQFRSVGAATGRMCISKGSKISIFNGTKNIEDIKSGDLVYCYDSSRRLILAPVKNLWLTGENRECVKIKWNDHNNKIGILICTPEHPVLISTGEWIEASKLKKGDNLVHIKHNTAKGYDLRDVISVKKCENSIVYDIEVENHHNFIANGICVHNSSAEPNLQNIPSHATDIRHMFRATAARDEMYDCKYDEDSNEISIELFKYDSVYGQNGELVKVYNLAIGDTILLKDGVNEEYKKLVRIENSKKDVCNKVLIFES